MCVFFVDFQGSLITSNQQLSRASIYHCQGAASLLTDRGAHIHTRTHTHTHTHIAHRRNERTSDALIQGTHTLFMECFSGLSSGDLLQFFFFLQPIINQMYLFSRHDICFLINIQCWDMRKQTNTLTDCKQTYFLNQFSRNTYLEVRVVCFDHSDLRDNTNTVFTFPTLK